jgi:hypothetical protein
MREVIMRSEGWLGLTLVKAAAVYLVIALALGMVMAVRKDFSLMSVHSHLGLLGWAAMGLTGLVYLVVPRTGRGRLAVTHFWLHNVGLPVMMAGLAVEHGLGDARVEPVIGFGSTLVMIGLVVFAVNLFRNGILPESRPGGGQVLLP